MNILSIINGFLIWGSIIATQKWFSPVINLLTVIILAWTAWEALRTSRATSQANNLKLLPLLGIYFYRGRLHDDDLFKVKNLGEGVAYDIRIDPWTLIMQDVHEIIEFKMMIRGTNILSSKEEKEISTEVFTNGVRNNGLSGGLVIAYLRGLNTTGIQIHFKDATGRECASLISISDTKLTILEPTYRVGLFRKIKNWYGLTVTRNFKIKLEEFLWKHEERTIGKVPNYKTRFVSAFKKVIKIS